MSTKVEHLREIDTAGHRLEDVFLDRQLRTSGVGAFEFNRDQSILLLLVSRQMNLESIQSITLLHVSAYFAKSTDP